MFKHVFYSHVSYFLKCVYVCVYVYMHVHLLEHATCFLVPVEVIKEC